MDSAINNQLSVMFREMVTSSHAMFVFLYES